MAEESYVAFYTQKPFWAGNALDFGSEVDPAGFTRQMTEIVFTSVVNGSTVRIAKDGQIQIQSSQIEAKIDPNKLMVGFDTSISLWAEYLRLLNAFYLGLDMACAADGKCAPIDLHEITREDAFRMRYEKGIFDSGGLPQHSFASPLALGQYLSAYRKDTPIAMDIRILSRRPIPITVLQQATDYFRIFSSKTDLLEKANMLSKAISEYKRGDINFWNGRFAFL